MSVFRGKSVVLLEARVNVIDVLPRFFASIARHEHEQVYVILSGFNRFDERVQGIRTLSLCLLIERGFDSEIRSLPRCADSTGDVDVD